MKKTTSANACQRLRLSGVVEARAKRYVPKDNPTTEVVSYTVSDNRGKQYYLQDYAPASYYQVGEAIDVPVYIKPYSKGSALSFTINYLKPQNNSRGEEF